MSNVVFSKTGNLNDSVFGKSTEPVMMTLERHAEAFEQKSAIKKLFKMAKSKNFAEKIASMTSMSGFQPVGEGGEYPQDSMQESFSKVVEFETWKDQFMITKELVEDSKTLDLQQKPSAFVAGYYRARERFAASLFMGGVNNAPVALNGKTYNILSADGEAVFSKNHPSKITPATKQSNRFADAFSLDALAKMETAMQNFKDDNGNVLALAPDTLVIPNDWKLKRDVFAAIGADKDPNTANNGFNYTFGRYTVVIWPYLNSFLGTHKQPWILLDSDYNQQYGGAVWIDRVPLTVSSWVDNSNDNNVWNGRARFMAGFNDWRFAALGGVADGSAL